MSKSRCAKCHKVLKGGEWVLQKSPTGVVKVCYDKRACNLRKRLNETRELD